MKHTLKELIEEEERKERRRKKELELEKLYWETVFLNQFDPYDEAGDR